MVVNEDTCALLDKLEYLSVVTMGIVLSGTSLRRAFNSTKFSVSFSASCVGMWETLAM